MSFPRYQEYKDSGVELLGEIPSQWSVMPFKWQILKNEGGVWGNDPLGEGDTFVLRSTDQTVDGKWKVEDPAIRALNASERRQALLSEGDLVVTKSSGSSLHIGKTTLVTSEIAEMGCCFGNFMQRIRMKPSFMPEFAWYVMNNDIARIQLGVLSNSTTGLANLNGPLIGEMELVVPPLKEQQKIAAFLDHETAKIDALIAEQQRLIELLKEKRQAVISHAVTKGLNPNAPMKDSGVEWLGEVPEHWEIKKIKHAVASLDQGWSPQCDNFPATDEEPGVLKVGCVNGGVFNSSQNKRLPEELEFNSDLAVRAGDLLVSRANTRDLVGSAAVSPQDFDNLMVSDKLYRIRLIHGYVDPQFLCFYLGTGFARREVELAATGASSSMLNIGQGTVLEMPFPCPPFKEQEDIRDCVFAETHRIIELSVDAEALVELLKERRSALISAAVTGKIDVRGWQPSESTSPDPVLQAAEEAASYG
jgi:type I restriction enzyme S subunit